MKYYVIQMKKDGETVQDSAAFLDRGLAETYLETIISFSIPQETNTDMMPEVLRELREKNSILELNSPDPLKPGTEEGRYLNPLLHGYAR